MTLQSTAQSHPAPDPVPNPVYAGQFGEFTITRSDRRGVILYRASLIVAALAFAIGCELVIAQGDNPMALSAVTFLYTVFTAALGVSLLMIHIYMVPLHRTLQAFWLIGAIAAVIVAHGSPEPFILTVYQNPRTILGIGFTFAALTGIFFKEAFCFNRLETKALTPIVPILLLGHLFSIFPLVLLEMLLSAWAVLFLVFAFRKAFQAIPDDIGDKSVFTYLERQRSMKT